MKIKTWKVSARHYNWYVERLGKVYQHRGTVWNVDKIPLIRKMPLNRNKADQRYLFMRSAQK